MPGIATGRKSWGFMSADPLCTDRRAKVIGCQEKVKGSWELNGERLVNSFALFCSEFETGIENRVLRAKCELNPELV